MMIPVYIATLNHAIVERIAARACQMQGCPEVHYYGVFNAEQRASCERGVYNTIAALESLGFTLLGPEELSPVLPHDREAQD